MADDPCHISYRDFPGCILKTDIDEEARAVLKETMAAGKVTSARKWSRESTT